LNYTRFNPSFDGNPEMGMYHSTRIATATPVSILLLMEIPKWVCCIQGCDLSSCRFQSFF